MPKQNHVGDSSDATCAFVGVLCIPLHAKAMLSEYIDGRIMSRTTAKSRVSYLNPIIDSFNLWGP